jgi:hypothetical protein
MQSPRSVQQANRDTHIRLTFAGQTNKSSQTVFRKTNFANQGNQESRLRMTTRRSLHAGYVPNGVRWKNLLRRLLSPAAGIRFQISFPDFRMLELAKGFEPLTL